MCVALLHLEVDDLGLDAEGAQQRGALGGADPSARALQPPAQLVLARAAHVTSGTLFTKDQPGDVHRVRCACAVKAPFAGWLEDMRP